MENNVYRRLQIARLLLQEKKLSKSGKNKFAGYEYFELQDFLPAVQTIFADTGLCAVFRVRTDAATLTIYNMDAPSEEIIFTAPMASADLKGCHPVQNLGASISYLRRYLYVNALEIVEHDALDATTGSDTGKPVAKALPKPAAKPGHKPIEDTGETTGDGIRIAKANEDTPIDPWEMKATGEPGSADWMAAIEAASQLALGLAQSADDVMAIYKTNKKMFEEIKSHDAVFFKDLMDKFSEAKRKFTEEAA